MDYNQEQILLMQQYQYGPRMPFYMSYPMQSVYMTELEYERDMERMKELYPEDAKQIQRLVEEECDKMEYEGSMMFDEYPDRVMLRAICSRIYDAVQGGEPSAETLEAETVEEETLEAQNFGPGRPPGRPGRPPGRPGGPGRPPGRPPHDRGLSNLIEVLLYNEMYKRRCRHNRCRHWW